MTIDMKNFGLNRQLVSGLNQLDYFSNDCKEPKEIWLLLHGYQEKAQTIVKKLKSIIPDNVLVIAPNGPYPLPQKVQNADNLRFAWYFYDSTNDEYYIDYAIACSLLKDLFSKLELNELPLKIIGYSQGGYLAPFVGDALENTTQILGINCSIRTDYLPKKLDFTIDQIHAEKDEFVDPLQSKARFDKLISQGNQGSFTLLPDETHFLGLNYLDKIKALLDIR